jgi:hypothetical protein
MWGTVSPIPSLVNELNGYEFEDFLAEFFARRGWIVEQTPYSNDKGKDLFVTHPHSQARYAIEAKNWNNSAFSKRHIQKYIKIAEDPEIDGFLIVCTDKQRKGTLQALRGKPKVRIVNRRAVFDEIRRYNEEPLLRYHAQYRVEDDRDDSESLKERCRVFHTKLGRGSSLSPATRQLVLEDPYRDVMLSRLEAQTPPNRVTSEESISRIRPSPDELNTTRGPFGLGPEWRPSGRSVGYR